VDEWFDDNPYFVLLTALEPNENGMNDFLILDVGEPQWQVVHSEWLRRPATWYLCEKAGAKNVKLAQIVFEGDQPYYVKRHIGQIMVGSGQGRSLIAYGIGKKVPARENNEARTERLWLLPGGVVCAGDDVEKLGMAIVETMAWGEPPPPE
jgi:hypothetical protein